MLFLLNKNSSTESTTKIKRALTQGNAFCDDVITQRKDGTSTTDLVNIEPVFDADGSITHFLGVHTGKKPIATSQPHPTPKTQNVFKPHSQYRIDQDTQAHIESITQISIIEINDKQECRELNHRLCELTGRRDQELMQLGWLDCIDSADRESYQKGIDAFITSDDREKIWSHTLRVQHINGETRTIKSSLSFRNESSNRKEQLLILWMDITDIVISEKKADLQHQKNQSLIHDIHQIVSHLEDGQFDFARDSSFRYDPIIKKCYQLADTLQTLNGELIALCSDVGTRKARWASAPI